MREGLYQSGFRPHGVRKDWERNSMDHASTQRLLGPWALNATVTDAVAWFDDDGWLRALVADLDATGDVAVLRRRIVLRCKPSGRYTINFQAVPHVQD